MCCQSDQTDTNEVVTIFIYAKYVINQSKILYSIFHQGNNMASEKNMCILYKCINKFTQLIE